MNSNNPSVKKTLWTRDFTIITLGSVVSMFGNAMSGFAMSLLVLDYTNSSLLYAIYIVIYTLPQIVMPILSGAILDRFSRKKTIYTLDFISAGLYAAAALILNTGWFNFTFFALYCFIIGSINSIYTVAYQSFYPLLITEGNYSKAYSISSILETLSALMVPVATYIYNLVGIAPLLGINAICFLTAAIFETQIRSEEKYISESERDKEHYGKQLFTDIKEGLKYVTLDRGLLAIAMYFAFSAFACGGANVVTLPYFKANFESGEYVYMMVWGMSIAGRCLGGLVQYIVKIPVKIRYFIALGVYIATCTLEGIYFYFPVPLMMCMTFTSGLLGVTSYNIRISATQMYVPDNKKGRFNGAFNMLNTVGSLTGEMLAGAFTVVLDMRYVISVFMFINLLSAIVFIGGSKKQVSEIYNRTC